MQHYSFASIDIRSMLQGSEVNSWGNISRFYKQLDIVKNGFGYMSLVHMVWKISKRCCCCIRWRQSQFVWRRCSRRRAKNVQLKNEHLAQIGWFSGLKMQKVKQLQRFKMINCAKDLSALQAAAGYCPLLQQESGSEAAATVAVAASAAPIVAAARP